MAFRQAVPGAIKVPPGARDRERLRALEDQVAMLAREVQALKATPASGTSAVPSTPGGVVNTHEGAPDKAPLVARAHELGLGAPSQLTRWSVEKLQAAIAEKEKA